ncbi:sigma-70 family RNA polymerase sigma factor [Sporosarcina sp. ANT_H38]|uniref:sigma-70 family RNA polymerase sigma factor n=1 Tax=Sporosarcina sp. ANT_H38 TaxID=2597358 RepID=UPI0011F3C203|nr:sigma-70 family RNA polymerase sigma factor [Sporosarcina sp. ANT_H38]KAA0965750.1 sigma-70 family RNA polymerase sigma factor [Sporosarcina sp. ANT_H38]
MNLDEAFRQYTNELYRYLFSLSKDHHTAEDLVQEAFYRAYLQLEDYEITNIKAWLFKVAHNAFIDHYRKNKRVVIREHVQESLSFTMKTPEDEFVEKEGFILLLKDIHSLKDQERHALILCDLHHFKYQEAAAILEMKLNTFKSNLMRGRRKVMEKIIVRRNEDERRQQE